MTSLLTAILALTLFLSPASYAWSTEDRCQELSAQVEGLPEFFDVDASAIREGLALIRETRACFGDEAREQMMELYLDETYALYELGYFREALATLDSLLDRFEVGKDSTVASRAYQWRGFVYYHAGDLTQAISNYVVSLSYTSDSAVARKAHRYLDIAAIYQRMGDFQNARRSLDEGRMLIEKGDSTSEDLLEVKARLLTHESDLLQEELAANERIDASEYVRAGELAREGLRIWTQLGNRSEMGNALLRLSDALSSIGETEESLYYLSEASQIFEERGDVDRQANVAWKQGQAHLRAGNYVEADASLGDALLLARAGRHLDYHQRILRDRALLFELQQDWQRAAHYYRLGMGVAEAYRAPLRGTQWSPHAFEAWQASHRGLVRALLMQEQYEEAFLTLEQTRARHLDDLQQQHRLVASLQDDQRASFDSLSSALVEVRTALVAESVSSTTGSDLRLKKSLLEAERRSLLDLEGSPPVLDVADLQEVLDERNAVLVSYFIDKEPRLIARNSASHVFVITADTVRAVPLDVDWIDVRDMLASVSSVLDENASSSPGLDDQQFALDGLHELYTHLVAPIREHLQEGVPLAIVPDGPLYGLPFGMLVEEGTPRFRYHEAPFLLRRHPISVQLTARALLASPEQRTEGMIDLVAVGQSSYQNWVSRASLAGIVQADSLVDLKAVPEEVAGIARLFKNARVLLDVDITKSRLSEEAQQARVLHIASHTAFSTLSPMYNALLVGQGEEYHGGGGSNGMVYLHELQQWKAPSEMVVLSGCDTGRGLLMGGEGMTSLQYAFHSVGVPSSVATLWLVEDAAMANLMQRFYRHLRDGLPKDEALQRAQLEYLEGARGPWASPFFWAAPVLYGAPHPVALEARPLYRAPWFLYLVGLACILIAAGVWHRRALLGMIGR